MPYKSEGRKNYPNVNYDPPKETADPAWLRANGLTPDKLPALTPEALPRAVVVEIQAVDEFSAFTPMERIATADETRALLAAHPGAPYLLFPEDRTLSIRMTDDLPYRWAVDGPAGAVKGRAARGEYFSFQIGLWAAREPVTDLEVTFSDLVKAGPPAAPGGHPGRSHDLPQQGRRRLERLAAQESRPRRKRQGPGPLVRRPGAGLGRTGLLQGHGHGRPGGTAADDPRRRARRHRRAPRRCRRRRSLPHDPAALARLDPGPGRRHRSALFAPRGRPVHGPLPRALLDHRPGRLPGPHPELLRARDDPPAVQASSRDGRPDPAPGHRRGRERARLDAERHRSAGGPARSRDRRLGSRQLQRRLPHAGRGPHGIRRLRRIQSRRVRPERRVRRGHPARSALEPGGRRVHDGPRTQGRRPARDVRLGLGPEKEPGRALDRLGQRRAPGRTAGRELFAAAQHEFLPVEAPEHAAVLVERRQGHGDRADGRTGPGRRQGPRRRHDRRGRGRGRSAGARPSASTSPSSSPRSSPSTRPPISRSAISTPSSRSTRSPRPGPTSSTSTTPTPSIPTSTTLSCACRR